VTRRRITVIHGPRDSGKTKTAAALAARMRAQGMRVGGVLSEAEMRSGVKVSYSFFDLGTAERSLYALRRPEPIPQGVRAYEFLPEGLDFGRRAVLGAVEAGAEAIIVDEIGPLEMEGRGLWDAVRDLLSRFSGEIVIVVRDSLLDGLPGRLGVALSDLAAFES